jgi:hypothetical protein
VAEESERADSAARARGRPAGRAALLDWIEARPYDDRASTVSWAMEAIGEDGKIDAAGFDPDWAELALTRAAAVIAAKRRGSPSCLAAWLDEDLNAAAYHVLGTALRLPTSIFDGVGPDGPDHLELLSAADLERMTAPYRWLIERAGRQGVVLTKAGYLPPALVQEAAARSAYAPFLGLVRTIRETKFPVVTALRESAVELGLLRKDRGVLRVTRQGRKLADDPAGLLRFGVDRLAYRTTGDLDRCAAGVFAALVTFADPDRPVQSWNVVAEVLTEAGWRVAGEPLGWIDARSLPLPARRLFLLTGAVNETGDWMDGYDFEPGPGGVELARALLAAPLKL